MDGLAGGNPSEGFPILCRLVPFAKGYYFFGSLRFYLKESSFDRRHKTQKGLEKREELREKSFQTTGAKGSQNPLAPVYVGQLGYRYFLKSSM